MTADIQAIAIEQPWSGSGLSRDLRLKSRPNLEGLQPWVDYMSSSPGEPYCVSDRLPATVALRGSVESLDELHFVPVSRRRERELLVRHAMTGNRVFGSAS